MQQTVEYKSQPPTTEYLCVCSTWSTSKKVLGLTKNGSYCRIEVYLQRVCVQGCTTASGLSEVLQWNSKEHFGAILVEFVLILEQCALHNGGCPFIRGSFIGGS